MKDPRNWGDWVVFGWFAFYFGAMWVVPVAIGFWGFVKDKR